MSRMFPPLTVARPRSSCTLSSDVRAAPEDSPASGPKFSSVPALLQPVAPTLADCALKTCGSSGSQYVNGRSSISSRNAAASASACLRISGSTLTRAVLACNMNSDVNPIATTTMNITTSMSVRPRAWRLRYITGLRLDRHWVASDGEGQGAADTRAAEPVERKGRRRADRHATRRDEVVRSELVGCGAGIVQAKAHLRGVDKHVHQAAVGARLPLRVAQRGLNLLAKPSAIRLSIGEKRQRHGGENRRDDEGDHELEHRKAAAEPHRRSCCAEKRAKSSRCSATRTSSGAISTARAIQACRRERSAGCGSSDLRKM